MTDELAALKAHRAAVANPTNAAWSAARGALAKAIAQETAGARRDRAGGDREYAAIDARPTGSRHARARDNRKAAVMDGHPTGSRLRVRLALALTLAAGAIAVAAALRQGSPGAPAPAATQVLERLAAVAASRPPLLPSAAPGAGRYRYTHTQSIDAAVYGRCAILRRKDLEEWIARDGSGLQRETVQGSPEFTSNGDRARCAAMLASSAPTRSSIGSRGERRETLFARGCLSVAPVPLAGLPTDPMRLRRRLETGKVEGGPPGPGEAFTQVGDLLRNTDASPALRAALYRAAAGLAGVRSLGTVADQVGRRGVALAIVDRGISHELIFDPDTSALLAEQETAAQTGAGYSAPVGRVIERAAYWPAAIANRLPSDTRARPTVSCGRAALRPLVPAREAPGG
jgi:hypothetical protein